jgi:UDP-N-acetylmuramate dehydrogenase
VPELLADHTTLRLGGPARDWVRAATEQELIDAVTTADASGTPVLVLAGGSNLVIADEGFDGLVVEVATSGMLPDTDDCEGVCGGVMVRVAAGENWDEFVAVAVERGWVGVEALSGIPGSVGATPIQNVGAYGQEVAQTIASVRVWDRTLKGIRTFAAADCGFGYRHSRFKADLLADRDERGTSERPRSAGGTGRHVVLSVDFQLRPGTLGAPIEYAELARAVGVEAGRRAPLADVRRAVLGLRAGKGMVLDPADHDTWSAGSFFTNPHLTPEQAAALPTDAPRWPQADGTVKSSAAWLIERAGFGKGYDLGGRVSLSTKHTLALTNRGSATTGELIELARAVRDGVERAFGVRLVNEPVLVGCSL